jgi:hypothetical protein
MRKFIILLIIGVFFASCKKKRTIYIAAKNAATGEGYAGLGFILSETKGYVTSTGEVQKKVYEGTLNAQGEAVFDYKLKNNRSYVLTTLVPEEELCYINNTSYTLSNLDDNYKFDFLFAGCAYLKFRYQNINCQNSNDHIIVKRYTNLDDYSGFIIDAEYDGCNDYIMPNFTVVPMGQWIFEWEVTKNNITSNFSDTIFLNAGEQRYYEFNY